MMEWPPYLEATRTSASETWDLLEARPDLAGPWHQLFQQVQSPRHVLSELLQNADDVGATSASVMIEDDEFVFCHNGRDFSAENFASLCRFGYSDKRALHTTGFRGVGFKSTFSIGDEVQLRTPTLSVVFRRSRFTEPAWVNTGETGPGTQVRVRFKDRLRQHAVEENLEEWLTSPTSLLFFQNIRSLRIRETEVRWELCGAGPVPGSEWMALSDATERQYLLLRAQEETFPADALAEIRQERMFQEGEGEGDFPPCRVEIVLGATGRLFVVLPTGVRTTLPFACNAPFIQDAARTKIKEPELSPTNRWLLKRVGELAASGMLEWLNRSDLTLDIRSAAYQLLPAPEPVENSLDQACTELVKEAFYSSLTDKPVVLSDEGQLTPAKRCVAAPSAILDVWPTRQVENFFAGPERSVLSRHVSATALRILVGRGFAYELSRASILTVLETKQLPVPKSWDRLLALWAYVSPAVSRLSARTETPSAQIVPVNGQHLLYSARDVVRLGERQLLRSQEDWQFLAGYLLVLNQNWPRYLAEQRRRAETAPDDSFVEEVTAAYELLEKLGLAEPGDANRILQRVAEQFFSREGRSLDDAVHLAHIAAALGASVSSAFRFFTQNGELKAATDQVIADVDGDLDLFLDSEQYDQHALHHAYSARFESCTRLEWQQWLSSGRSGLLTFVPLQPTKDLLWSRDRLRTFLEERDFSDVPVYPYRTNEFLVDDWDFDRRVWAHWQSMAGEDEGYWSRVVARVIEQPSSYWARAASAKVSQVATTRYTKPVTQGPLLPAWVVRFGGLPCLQDTWGIYRQPAELLRRTPETEPFLDAEAFVRPELDTEATRQLLIMLGVRSTPTGAKPLLERLAALSKAERPPVYEVEKWCHRVDQVAQKASTEELQAIKTAFHDQSLILTESGTWVRSSEVFLRADETAVPGAHVIHPSVRGLSLWHRIGVADRPTVELTIEWLKSLPSGQKVPQAQLRQVRSLLQLYPSRVWTECRHWLNLDGSWAPTPMLAYALSMQSLVAWGHLFPGVKVKIADFQMLSSQVLDQEPFNRLPSLAAVTEDRFTEPSDHSPTTAPSWLRALGSGLSRIVLDDLEQATRIRTLGQRLADTRCRLVSDLSTVPYIKGVPAGTKRSADVLWAESVLYIKDATSAKMARVVALEIGRAFNREEVADAIKICYDRSVEFVTEYLNENFKLVPEEVAVDSLHASSGVTNGSTAGARDESVRSGDASILNEEAQGGNAALDRDSELAQSGPNEDSDTDDLDLEDDADHPVRSRQRPAKPEQPSLMERFAIDRAFKANGPDRFSHADGSWIQRVPGNPCPWELHSPNGDLIKCYWPKDHCLERQPLELDAVIWSLCDTCPDLYSVVLAEPDGSPTEVTGRSLLELRDEGKLSLYPATYRLVLSHE